MVGGGPDWSQDEHVTVSLDVSKVLLCFMLCSVYRLEILLQNKSSQWEEGQRFVSGVRVCRLLLVSNVRGV